MGKILAQTVGEVPKKPLVRKIHIAILLIVIVVSAVASFWWLVLRVPPVEYKTYSKYGFSFQYPKEMTMIEKGLLESTATDNSGIVLGQLRPEGLVERIDEHIVVGWLKSATAPDLEISLKDAFDALVKSEELEIRGKGKLVETTKAGHRMIYQYYTTYGTTTAGPSYYNFPPKEVYGIYGVWYCDTKQRLYQLNLMYIEEKDILPIFQRYLDSFVCH